MTNVTARYIIPEWERFRYNLHHMTQQPQWLGRNENPIRYMELIDTPDTEGYLIRERVIFPTLFALMRETLGKSHTPLVDFGSGTGSLTAQLSTKLGLPVEGVDASAKFVKLANKRYPQLNFYKTTGSAPVGWSMHNTNAHLVFHCTPQPKALLENMIATTEPAGYIFVTIPHPEYFKTSGRKTNKRVQTVTLGGMAKMTYYRMSIAEYEAMFTKAGLHIVKKVACLAPENAPATLEKYKNQPGFIVYALQKKVDVIDTVLLTHSGSGKILLLTRALTDDKFPGVNSFFSVRRVNSTKSGPQNLAKGMDMRLGFKPDYISPYPLGNLLVKHKHRARTQIASVNLYAAKLTGPMPKIRNEFYVASHFITPDTLRPTGGACTQLGYQFLRAHK